MIILGHTLLFHVTIIMISFFELLYNLIPIIIYNYTLRDFFICLYNDIIQYYYIRYKKYLKS